MFSNSHNSTASFSMVKAAVLAGTLAVAGAATAAPLNVQAGNAPLLRGSRAPVVVGVGPGRTPKASVGKVRILGRNSTAHVHLPLTRGPNGKATGVRIASLPNGGPRR